MLILMEAVLIYLALTTCYYRVQTLFWIITRNDFQDQYQ